MDLTAIETKAFPSFKIHSPKNARCSAFKENFLVRRSVGKKQNSGVIG